jgi:proline-specific peptidase
MITTEGLLERNGNRTWYTVYGDLDTNAVPLIGLHGGPAWPHYSLLPLTRLVDSGIPVILYDQLGCGKSDRPHDPDLWTLGAYVDELDALRKHLNINKTHLLGHSWGGTLAMEYALAHPAAVDKLIVNSPLVDTRLWLRESDRLKDSLPDGIAQLMRRHEREGTTDDPEYQEAYSIFQQQFVCRIVPQPKELDQADAEMGREVYEYMWGPSEAHATGTLKDYSILDRLSGIRQQTLILSGKYDEATPAQMELIIDAIPDAKWELFKESSHSALFEETAKYLQIVREFLS